MRTQLRRPLRAASFVELREPLPLTLEERHAPSFDASVDWDALEPRTRWTRLGKPLLDELLLALTIVPALALGLAVGIANAIAFRSFRKVLFVQPRVGHRGRIFRLVKFRTMAEPKGSTFEAWSGGDQARVTRFGRFLRSTHLDELPQLINVLRGEMGFIGPRPEMVEVEEWADANVPGFVERLALKPGITGLAQVTQGYTPRDVAAYALKLEIGREYLRRCSARLDLEILARTALWMVRGRGWRWRESSGGATKR